MTREQRDTITVFGNSKSDGLMIYNTTSRSIDYWDGVKWESIFNVPKNEGVIKIKAGGSPAVTPKFSFQAQDSLSVYKRIVYKTPLVYEKTAWSENSITAFGDNRIVNGFNFVENNIVDQTHDWRIILKYTNKAQGGTNAITLRLSNPSSTLVLEESRSCLAGVDSGILVFNFKTIADTSSLPFYLGGTGKGYEMSIKSAEKCNVEILSVSRFSNYKD